MSTPLDTLTSKVFSSNSNCYFFDIADYSVKAAVATATPDGFTVTKLFMKEGADKFEVFRQLVQEIATPKKGELVRAGCGIYPKNRFIYKAVLDNPAKSREPSFFQNFLKDKFNVDVNKSSVGVLNAKSGNDYQAGTPMKDVVFVGAASDDIQNQQDKIVSAGVYPEVLECSSVSSMGVCINYLKRMKATEPTLVLELRDTDLQAVVVKDSTIDFCKTASYGYDYLAGVIQKQMNVADLGKAKAQLFSPKSDFSTILPALIQDIRKELSSFISLYELDSNTNLKHFILLDQTPGLSSLGSTLAKELGLQLTELEVSNWLQACNLKVTSSIKPEGLSKVYLNLFSLMSSLKN
jgi:hypothetical protein